MKKAVKTGKPSPAPVAKTPYGLEPLVKAASKITDRHVLSDVTSLVTSLSSVRGGFERFVRHTGFMDPDGRIALLDYGYAFNGGGLANLNITFYAYRISGGNGFPLEAGEERLVFIRMKIRTSGWGELYVDHLGAQSPEWVEWAKSAAEGLKAQWEADLRAGKLARLTDEMAREALLSRWQRDNWCRDKLASVSTNLGLRLEVVDDDQDAPEHASSLEHQASSIQLVTPWLAEKLKQAGHVADMVDGLPIWSRADTCSPHLEEVIQDIAYETFGSSVDSELASATQPKEL